VRLDFFDEIFIPAYYLFEDTSFDHNEQVWVWQSGDDMLYLDKNELVRFRIEEEEFIDNTPLNPSLRDSVVDADRNPPYRLIASCYQSGLGVVAWW
jgi:DNA-directed RNA polymerase III subunit RPC8